MVSIAIDGPAGAGKSTVAKAVAQELGYMYVDTGALYRAIGLFALEHGVRPCDASALVPRLGEIGVEMRHVDGQQRVFLCGKDVTDRLRGAEMGPAASDVSAIPEVRALLLEMQRDMARRYSVVMDGRDIGTVVLPNANVKIFLTAAPGARAQRRYAEYLAKGIAVSYNKVLEEIEQRDYNDSHRAASPLRQAPDAVLVDTSELDLAQSIALILEIIKDGTR